MHPIPNRGSDGSVRVDVDGGISSSSAGGVEESDVDGLPRRRIVDGAAFQKWLSSQAYERMVAFLERLAAAVEGKPNDVECSSSACVLALVHMLDELDALLDATPPTHQPTRFGNKAFRTWHEQLVKRAPALLAACLPDGKEDVAAQLAPYLCDSFGNATRIDYGTGHEASFALMLLCMERAGVLVADDYTALVVRVFRRYVQLMHKMLAVYWLEPAGSHGVWGLDDYQHLPFYFGASQLVGHATLQPRDIHRDGVVQANADRFLFMGNVAFLRSVKKGAPLAVTSPMLDEISRVPQGWPKITAGLMKMYRGEVLSKQPVIQHFLFGTLFPFE